MLHDESNARLAVGERAEIQRSSDGDLQWGICTVKTDLGMGWPFTWYLEYLEAALACELITLAGRRVVITTQLRKSRV